MRTAIEQEFIDDIVNAKYGIEPTAINPRTGKPYPTGISLETTAGALKEVVGAGIKGGVQQTVGFGGDIISLVRGVYDLGKSGGDIDAFLAGLEKPTGLPTTADVRKALNEAGLQIGTGENPLESAGELAAPGGYVKAGRKIGRAVKKATEAK